MTWKRGLLRLWASIAFLWASYWSWTYYEAHRAAAAWEPEIQFWRDQRLNSGSAENRDFDDKKMGEAANNRNQQVSERDEALSSGLLGLLVIGAAAALSVWVAQGFRKA